MNLLGFIHITKGLVLALFMMIHLIFIFLLELTLIDILIPFGFEGIDIFALGIALDHGIGSSSI